MKNTIEVSYHVEDFILEWWKNYQDKIRKSVEYVRQQAFELGGNPDCVALSRFTAEKQCRCSNEPMIASMHAALLGHIAMVLELAGFEAEINIIPIED